MGDQGRLSNYAAHAILNHLLRVESFDRPDVFVGALTGEPSDDGATLPEVSATGYSRVGAEWSRASGRLVSNTKTIEFAAAKEDWGTITHLGFFDSQIRGNLLGWIRLPDAQAVDSTGILKALANTITVGVASSNEDGSGTFSDNLAGKITGHLMGVQTFSYPSSLYMMALRGEPTGAGVYEEIQASDYTRILVSSSFGRAVSRLAANAVDIAWPAATEDWGTITHIGLNLNAPLGIGHLLWWAPVANPDTINSADALTFYAGDINISI